MKPGDVYNQKLLRERTQDDEDAVANLYMDNGYLFFQLDPIEVNVENDSIDLELRIYEGEQARINKVIIKGNDRLYEHVVRRELRTKPGELFSQIRTLCVRPVKLHKPDILTRKQWIYALNRIPRMER